jgi:hypothetical protein
VLVRPIQAASRTMTPFAHASRGYALTGHHELMVPLLAAALRK